MNRPRSRGDSPQGKNKKSQPKPSTPPPQAKAKQRPAKQGYPQPKAHERRQGSKPPIQATPQQQKPHAQRQAQPQRQPQAHPQRQAQPPRQSQVHPSQQPQVERPTRPAKSHPHATEPKVNASLHWREALGPLLADRSYQPLDEKALLRKLRVPPEETAAFEAFLIEQERTGHLMKVRHSLYVLPKSLGYSVGRLMMNERGFGFLVPVDPLEQDFYVASEDTSTAFHGDLVLARLKEAGRQRDSRLRGEVVKVLERKRRQIVGTLRKTPLFYFVFPDETRIPHDIGVPAPKDPATLGQKVVVELKDWTDRRKPPEGVITEVLGSPDAPGVDLLSIIRKHDLPSSFPENVEQEAANIPASIPPEELANREDFRKIFTLTIDPDDAKDFDDALSYKTFPNGDLDIYVHIADVSHFVQIGTAMDTEARERGNSTYLVDRVIPMLPEKLSNGICSLMPNVDRLVKTAIITLDKKAEIKAFRFAQGVIHSQKRFTYKEAMSLLSKPAKTPLATSLHELNARAQLLRKRRFAQGALDLEFPEIKVRVNDLGIPTHLERNENDESHQLIEEYMLLANEVVALELKRRTRPGVYRIHETPDPGRLEEFRAQAKSMGYSCGDLSAKGEIQKLLNKVKGDPSEGVVKIGLLKSLKRAMYSPKPLGHYGLSKINYTHFTSPIRRYSDLVVHRLLFGASKQIGDYTYDGLSRLCLHLSTTERSAAEAEQESVKLKKLEYFDRQAHATKRTTFTALVLEARSSGLMVQIPEFLVQGLIPMSGLEGDLFVFNAQRLDLTGQRTKLVLRAGQSLQVEVASVDLGRQQVDFKISKQNLQKLLVKPKV